MRVLYLDRLLCMEILADTLLLWAAGKLCSARRSLWRLALAGTLGGLYAVLTLYFPPAATVPGKVGALLGMLLLAYGREKKLWKLGLAFLFLCAVYGGVAAAVTLALGRATARALLFSAGISLGICALPFRFAGPRGGRSRLLLRGPGGTVELLALRDTGHELTDPFTGKSVVVASEEALTPIFSPEVRSKLAATRDLPPQLRLEALGGGFFLLPLRTVSGSGLALCGRAEELVADGESLGSCRVVFSREEIRAGGGCNALIGGEPV